MKLIRALSIAVATLIPISAIASPAVRACPACASCHCGNCHCPFCG